MRPPSSIVSFSRADSGLSRSWASEESAAHLQAIDLNMDPSVFETHLAPPRTLAGGSYWRTGGLVVWREAAAGDALPSRPGPPEGSHFLAFRLGQRRRRLHLRGSSPSWRSLNGRS